MKVGSHQAARRAASVALLSALLFAVSVSGVSATGNRLLNTYLRVDLPAVNGTGDYIAWENPGDQNVNTAPLDFVTGWFGVFLAPYNGKTNSGHFTQVGVLSDSMGIHWFVYSEDGVTCLRGQLYFQNKGCIGDPGDMGVGLNLWTKVELVTYNQGIWIARVYDQGGGAVDVATFPDTSVTIYQAQQDGEEGYSAQHDPYYYMNYFHQHPQYMVAGTGVFADWPASQPPNDNYFQMKNQDCQQTFYRGAFNIGGDNRSWNTGVNGYACNQDPQF